MIKIRNVKEYKLQSGENIITTQVDAVSDEDGIWIPHIYKEGIYWSLIPKYVIKSVLKEIINEDTQSE